MKRSRSHSLDHLHNLNHKEQSSQINEDIKTFLVKGGEINCVDFGILTGNAEFCKRLALHPVKEETNQIHPYRRWHK